MIKLSHNFNWFNIITSGLISGLSILNRPTILLFLPLALVYIFKIKKINFIKSLTYAGVFLTVMGTVLSSWSLRNYSIHKQFRLTRADIFSIFWVGNNPNFSGSTLNKKGESIFDLATADFKEKIKNMNDETTRTKEFLNESIIYIKKYPLRFIERTIKKFYYFWWFSQQVGLFYPKIWFILYKVFYFFVLIAGMLGVYFTYKEGLFKIMTEAALIIFLLLSISLIQSLFYIEIRHRWGIESLFLIFTAKGIQSFFAKFIPDISRFLKKETYYEDY